jgi:predicted MFS family arabinose efflux permease
LNLYLLVIVGVCLHVGFAGCRVNLSLFALHLGASAFTVGLIMSLLAVLPVAFSVKAGRVIDRIGVRRPMLAGATAEVAGILLAVAVPRLEALFAASCLIGAGFILFHIAVSHFAGLAGKPQDRAMNFSLLALGFSTSGFIGPMVTGFAIDAIGHRWTFLLLAGFALAALCALAALRIEVEPHAQNYGPLGKRRLTDLLATRTLRNVVLVSGILSMSWDLFTFVVPIHGSQIGLSATQIGLILGAFGAAIFCVRLGLPLFLHRVSEWQLLIGAMLATGATFVVFPLVTGMPLLLLLAFILGMGLGGAQPMVMSLLYNTAPSGRGAEAVGLRTLIVNASQLGMPLLFGALGTALGMTPVFWTIAASLLAGGYFARRR